MAEDIAPEESHRKVHSLAIERFAESQLKWLTIGIYFRALTPTSVARFVLTVLVSVVLVLLLRRTWIALVPFIVSGWLISWETGLMLVAIYFLSAQFVSRLAGSRLERRYINIHPAVMVVAIVALSELGFLWILVAAPVTAIIRDTLRDIHERLSEPPRPAGILPDDPMAAGVTQAKPDPSSIHIPLVYRHRTVKRKPSSL